jgi:hypothetical protein
MSSEFPAETLRGIYYSQWAYWCTLLMAAMSFVYLPAGSARNLVVLAPVLTALLGAAVVYWVYRSCDEYVRQRILKCAAATGIVMMFATLIYFLLELNGQARLSMIAVNLLGWTVFHLLLLYVVIRSR